MEDQYEAEEDAAGTASAVPPLLTARGEADSETISDG